MVTWWSDVDDKGQSLRAQAEIETRVMLKDEMLFKDQNWSFLSLAANHWIEVFRLYCFNQLRIKYIQIYRANQKMIDVLVPPDETNKYHLGCLSGASISWLHTGAMYLLFAERQLTIRYKVNRDLTISKTCVPLPYMRQVLFPRVVATHINNCRAGWQAEPQYVFLVCDLTLTPSRW